MQFNVSTNIKEISRHLTSLERKQIPFAVKNSINKTLFDLQREMKKQGPKKIDRPKPYTLRGFRVDKVKSKSNLSGMIIFNRDYAEIIVEGGEEGPKTGNKKTITPTQYARTDRFGNVSRANMRKYKTNKDKYFFGIPKGRTGKDKEGIWERTNRNQRIRQVARFSDKRMRPKTFPFYRIAEKKTEAVFDKHLDKEMANAIRTAK